jgi:RNA polymerase subunit RPABC4/transcription elongation factor Spt4
MPADPAGIEPAFCPECGTMLPDSAGWCPKCGHQTADPCWECGRALPTGADFCAYCGTANTQPAIVSCPGCRADVARGHGYCTACGTQARTVCSECDRPLRRDWEYCPSCGSEPAPVGEVVRAAEAAQAPPSRPEIVLEPEPAAGAAGLNEAGTSAYESENFQEAVRLFREATEAEPGNAGFWTNLGVAHSAVGDDLQAFNAYKRAVDLDPQEAAAYLFMGQLYLERERYTEAREAWEKLIAVAPDSEEAEEARDNLRNLDKV